MKYLTELWKECGTLAYLSDPQIGLTFVFLDEDVKYKKNRSCCLMDGILLDIFIPLAHFRTDWGMHKTVYIHSTSKRCIIKNSCPFMWSQEGSFFLVSLPYGQRFIIDFVVRNSAWRETAAPPIRVSSGVPRRLMILPSTLLPAHPPTTSPSKT